MIQPAIGYSSTPADANANAWAASLTDVGFGKTPATNKQLNFLGWTVLLLGLYAINKTTVGHEVIYLSMVLILIFLFSNNYERIMSRLTK